MTILSFPVTPLARRTMRGNLATLVDLWSDAILLWRSRRAAHAMQSLPDELLHDIGVDRGEIDQVVRWGRPERS